MEQTRQQQVGQTERQPAIPQLPPWPISRPGPKITEPPAGQRRLFLRTEQVVEEHYDQEKGRSRMRDGGK